MGLRLNVPSNWFRLGGRRYSRSTFPWSGKIDRIDYGAKDKRYYIYKCDDDQEDYPMTYADVYEFSKDEHDFAHPLLKKGEPYVDNKFYASCEKFVRDLKDVSLIDSGEICGLLSCLYTYLYLLLTHVFLISIHPFRFGIKVSQDVVILNLHVMYTSHISYFFFSSLSFL